MSKMLFTRESHHQSYVVTDDHVRKALTPSDARRSQTEWKTSRERERERGALTESKRDARRDASGDSLGTSKRPEPELKSASLFRLKVFHLAMLGLALCLLKSLPGCRGIDCFEFGDSETADRQPLHWYPEADDETVEQCIAQRRRIDAPTPAEASPVVSAVRIRPSSKLF